MWGKTPGGPPSSGTFPNPFTRPWFGWFGANPSLALISVAQLSCHGDGAHRAKPGRDAGECAGLAGFRGTCCVFLNAVYFLSF